MISKILKIFSRSLEQFFLTVGQNNFGNKIPILHLFSFFLCGIPYSPLNFGGLQSRDLGHSTIYQFWILELSSEVSFVSVQALVPSKFWPHCKYIQFLRPLRIAVKNYSTGCKRRIQKIFEFRIWKEPMLVLKQTIPQKKALIFSFNLTPWNWL